MPELPEVETIARVLRQGSPEQPALPGRHILGADLLWKRTLAEPAPGEFESRLLGQVIETIGRRGKFLYFQLTQGWLLFHLRMSGDLLVRRFRHALCHSRPPGFAAGRRHSAGFQRCPEIRSGLVGGGGG